MFRTVLAALVFALVAPAPTPAAQFVTDSRTNAPKVAAASDEGERAMKRFRIPKGFKVELFAAEPLLANPVAFAIDEKNRFFVAETFRLHSGVTDIRGHMSWLTNELASTSVVQRVEYMKLYEGKRFPDYEKEEDRVRLVWDSDGDGRADKATVFAGGFNSAAEGLGAGVLAHRGNIYYTDIPNLWWFRDRNKDGVADAKKSLLTGFGVRVGFLGHDLHGLRIGPDGRLYFTIGDRGAHVVAKEGVNDRVVSNPEEGAVYRCNLDGSNLEIYARGLRNPQELAFDAYGNLWTGDNNSDGGDPARWVYVVEGGDSGWRVGFQFLTQPNARGVWLSERMCYPQFPGQAAYILPPIANIGNGPSGLSSYPGAGLPERYENHFFLCDFRGSTGSGVHSFGVKPLGAGFEVTDRHDFVWELLATDGDFGYDGCFYISDWVEGWNKTGKGRIYRIYDPARVKDRAVAETTELFHKGFQNLSLARLTALLEHQDMRVRQEAQFSITDLGPAVAVKTFARVAHGSSNLFARLHAIWGLGQFTSRSDVAVKELMDLAGDANPEVRAQALKVAGGAHGADANIFAARLSDPSPRVRYFAALALGKSGRLDQLEPLLQMIRENGDRDVYLRHAGVMALSGMFRRAHNTDKLIAVRADSPESLRTQETIQSVLADTNASIRMAALLTLRRSESPEIARFLDDSNALLVAEAARAINDLPITNALPRLAALIEHDDRLLSFASGTSTNPGPRDAVLRRVINANYRLGGKNNALALAMFAATSQAPEAFRAEAITLLGQWAEPSNLDRISGLWRPLARRAPEPAAAALQPYLAALQKSPAEKIKLAATRTAGRLNIKSDGASSMDILLDETAAPAVRLEALKAMAANKDGKLPEAIAAALQDKNEALRREATRLQAQSQPDEALARLRDLLDKGSITEQQSAFATVAALPPGEADKLLVDWLGKLLAGSVKPEVALDLLDAAGKRDDGAVRNRLREFENKRPAADDLRNYRECLVGGNAEDGRKVFLEKAEASCVRCHKMNGEGGEVGPELTGLGSRKDRLYLLESIVFPNKQIAQGFESVTVVLKNGTTYAGILKKETADQLEINSPEDGLLTVKKSDVKLRERGLSAMPEELRQVLSKAELRDLVEFLFQSKETKPAGK